MGTRVTQFNTYYLATRSPQGDPNRMSTSKRPRPPNTHQRICEHHKSYEAMCNGAKRTGQRCTNRASLFPKGYFPTCRQHSSQLIPTRLGYCQALAECGEACGRICHYMPPELELCNEHAEGTPTLPCYILRLSTEIRVAIFRYLFPERISAFHPNSLMDDGAHFIHKSILRVNRQIHNESSAVLYEQVPFDAEISFFNINMLGISWKWNNLYRTESLSKITQRIRNIALFITIPAFESDDAQLYKTRDNVQHFTSLFHPSSPSQRFSYPHQLHVRPEVETTFTVCNWNDEERVCALIFVLSPLLELRNIRNAKINPAAEPPRGRDNSPSFYSHNQYNSDGTVIVQRDLQRKWNLLRACAGLPLCGTADDFINDQTEDYTKFSREFETSLCRPSESTIDPDSRLHREQIASLRTEFSKIKWFVAMVRDRDSLAMIPPRDDMYAEPPPRWDRTIFNGIDQVIDVARRLVMNEEFEQFSALRQILQKRWLDHLERQRQDAIFLGKSLWNFSDESERLTILAAMPGSVSTVGDFEPDDDAISATFARWPEMDLNFGLPFEEEDQELVEKWEDEKRLYFKFEGNTRFRLKTPHLLRELGSRA
ncbi:hypothetical protein B0J11DRAFT_530841 [Dendryphion nanum]|uniref:Uncharacterized protein n=1 Tax=Dendryphion nanum TaxID=256645 RepID=A0A9P9DTA7_9PLEO|nr:hypothetical protein B0J11DRAFT_530841 [Dendryphion nanum]